MTDITKYGKPVREALERSLEAEDLYKGSFLHQQRSERIGWPEQITHTGLLDITDRVIVTLAQEGKIEINGPFEFRPQIKRQLATSITREIKDDYEERVAELREFLEDQPETGFQSCLLRFNTDLLNGLIRSENTRPDFDYSTLIPITANTGLGLWEWSHMGMPLFTGAIGLLTASYTAYQGIRHLKSNSPRSLRIYTNTAKEIYTREELETLKTIHRELSAIAPQQKI